jgi:YidC/Oxa1 family membrane protein insertase
MKAVFNIIFFQPLYNALVFLASLPGHSLGLSTIVLTIAVRSVLLPFSHSASEMQKRVKAIEPEIKKIKEQYPNREEQAQKILTLYQTNKINPFSGLLPIFLQLPVLFALFFVFRGGVTAHSDLLYSFVSLPETINYTLVGIDLTQKSFIFAALLFISQFYLARLTMPAPTPKIEGEVSFKDDLARSMSLQMRYVLPVIIALISLSFPSAVALYWLTGNVFTIAYELWRRGLIKRTQI